MLTNNKNMLKYKAYFYFVKKRGKSKMKQEMQGLIIEILILIITIISTSTFFITYSNDYNSKLNKILAYSADYTLENITTTQPSSTSASTVKTLKITPITSQPATSFLILKLKKTNNLNNIKIKINDGEDYLVNYQTQETENYIYCTIYTIKTQKNLHLNFSLWQEEPSSSTNELEYLLYIEKNNI